VSPSWVSWSEIEVLDAEGDNVALNKKVTASGSYEDQLPGLAIDGDKNSSWNAGKFAPVIITVDLGQLTEVIQIRMLVSQSPAGSTVHTLSLGNADKEFEAVYTYSGVTKNGDWLIYPPPGGTIDGPGTDTGGDTGTIDGPGTNTGGDDPDLPKGLLWTRKNPMFISALAVSVGKPTIPKVKEYFNTFHANAVHLWGTGLPDEISGWEKANHPEFRWVCWVNDNGKSKGSVKKVIGGLDANPPGRIGYQIGDEPGLNGDGMVELKEIEQGINNVLAADPGALTIVNFSYHAKKIYQMLDYYGGQTKGDIFSYDRYSPGYSEHETMAMIRDYALKWERPYWRYIRAYHDVGKNDKGDKTKASDLRWDAFLGLVYGYTGHTWFVYQATAPHAVASIMYSAQGGLSMTKTPLWSAVAAINQELRHLGKTMTQLTSTDVRYKAAQGLWSPKGVKIWKAGAGNDPYITGFQVEAGTLMDDNDLAIGFFEDDAGEHYVMVQNQNHKNADWPINNTKKAVLRIGFDFAGAPGNVATLHVQTLSKTTGKVKNYPLSSKAGAKAELKVTLAAGDPILFKYDTGAPFAMSSGN
jgi:hypothetical protein